MRTELIYSSEENHPGYGAGDGDTERYEYKCPYKLIIPYQLVYLKLTRT